MDAIKKKISEGRKVFYKFNYENGFIFGAAVRNPYRLSSSPAESINVLRLNDNFIEKHKWYETLKYFQWEIYGPEKYDVFDFCQKVIDAVRTCRLSSVVKDSYLKTIFQHTLIYMQKNETKLFRKERLDTAITESEFIEKLRENRALPTPAITKMFCSRDPFLDVLIPQKECYLFLQFEPIPSDIQLLSYKSIIMHRKLFTGVVKLVCPYITVCNLEGGDCSHDVAKQFYSMNGDGFEFKNIGYRPKLSSPSTHIFVKTVIRTEKRNKLKKFACVSSKTGKTFLVPKSNHALNEIGVLETHNEATSLPKKYKRMNRLGNECSAENDYFPLIVVISKDKITGNARFNIMDAFRFVVLWRFKSIKGLAIRCKKLTNRDYEICYCDQKEAKFLGKRMAGYSCVRLEEYVEKTLRYVADMWRPGERARMFRNQAVKGLVSLDKTEKGITQINEDSGISVSCHDLENNLSSSSFSSYTGLANVVSLDFCKFYPRALALLKSEDSASKFVDRMLKLCSLDKRVKFDMNCTIGKMVHYHPRLYHALKACTVCIMYDLADSNCSAYRKLVGFSTDSVFVMLKDANMNIKPEKLKLSSSHFDLSLTRTVPIKLENSFEKLTFLGTVDRYVGVTYPDKKIVVRGYSCSRTKPSAEVKLIESVCECLLLNEKCYGKVTEKEKIVCEQLTKSIDKILKNLTLWDYVYPGTKSHKEKYHPIVIFESNLCQDRMLVLSNKKTIMTVLGYRSEYVMQESNPFYEDHINQTGHCYCDNCVSSQLAGTFMKKNGIFLGSCFNLDYEKYAEKWMNSVMTLLGHVLKYSDFYEGTIDEIKSFQRTVMTSIVEILNTWVIQMAKYDFVPVAGHVQPNY